MKYRCIGEITQTSVLHGHPSGKCEFIASSFREARDQVQEWLGIDGSDERAPRKANETLIAGDWTYRIEPLSR